MCRPLEGAAQCAHEGDSDDENGEAQRWGCLFHDVSKTLPIRPVAGQSDENAKANGITSEHHPPNTPNGQQQLDDHERCKQKPKARSEKDIESASMNLNQAA